MVQAGNSQVSVEQVICMYVILCHIFHKDAHDQAVRPFSTIITEGAECGHTFCMHCN